MAHNLNMLQYPRLDQHEIPYKFEYNDSLVRLLMRIAETKPYLEEWDKGTHNYLRYVQIVVCPLILVYADGSVDTGYSRYVFSEEELAQQPKICPANLMLDAKPNQIIQFEKAKDQIRHGIVDFGVWVGDVVDHYVVRAITKRAKFNRQVEYKEADCGNESTANGAYSPVKPSCGGCEVKRSDIVSMEYIIPSGE